MTSFVQQLQYALLSKPSATPAHQLMAPAGRKVTMPLHHNAKLAAVAIVLFLENQIIKSLFILRPTDQSVHSNQISFAGGKHEQDDYSLTYTAIRELEEELGIAKENVQVLGSLSSLYIPPSNFIIQPIVLWSENNFTLTPNNAEVIETFSVDLFTLFKHKKIIDVRNAVKKQVQAPAYVINEQFAIWGATAMVLSELECLIKSIAK